MTRAALRVVRRLDADRPSPRDLWAYVRGGDAGTLLTTPIVYSVIVPFLLLDVWVTAYEGICFRAWGIRRVRRRDYFAIDRHRLPYLNALEKLNCMFCSYANGVVAYVAEVAARTEQYWCPIRHGRRVRGRHGRDHTFTPYADAAAYRRQLPLLRAALRR
ncbi:MAG TPA: hypothetical protein VF239_06945 [Vicinamibacterales bacterium]|jgi:hypothetical protein